MAEAAVKEGYLVTEDLVKRFDEALAVDEVSLSIRQGEIFALLGSSGCGKSTLLRMLAGFETPTSGRILLGGQDVAKLPPYERPINMMFQSYALFPHLNIWDNVAFGLKREGLPKAEIQQRVGEMLDLVQLGAYAKRKPHQLSGGQQQRVALARSLAKRPKLLLLDEPLGALDLKLREDMQDELKSLQQRLGITFVFVTHDQHEALSMADSLAVFNQGKIAQIGTPADIYTHPRTRFVADFVGSSNVLPPALTKALGGPAQWSSLRPENTRLAPHGPITGTVTALRYLGAATRVVLKTGETELAALVPAGQPLPEPGTGTSIAFDPKDLHLMEENRCAFILAKISPPEASTA